MILLDRLYQPFIYTYFYSIYSLKDILDKFSMDKKERGQFYTVNHSYIMDGFDKPTSKVH